LNAALNGLTYTPTSAYWGLDSLAVTVKDPGDGLSASTSVALTVDPLSPPTITAPMSATLGENLSLNFSTANGNSITVADANIGTKADTLTLTVTNGTLTLGSTPGLVFKSGKNGTASFSIASTLANLNTALNGLTYKPTAGYSGSDTLAISILNTGDGQSASTSVALTVTPATAPVITAPIAASLNENSSLVFSAANSNAVSFADANAGTSKTESLTLSAAHGTLKLATMSGLTVAAGANNSASMTVTGTAASLNAALNGLTYTPTSAYWGLDSLAVTVKDPGDGLSESLSVALTVNVLMPTVTAPVTASVAENGSLVFSTANGNPISLADVNAGSGLQQITLTSTEGTIQTGSTTGITFVSGSNKSSSMTLSGTLTNLNNALKNLTFRPTTGYSGPASISLTYTDVGNGLTSSASIAVSVGNAEATATPASAMPAQLSTTSPPASSTGAGFDNQPTNTEDGLISGDSDFQWAGFTAAMEVLST
jgi:hypothetical protein